MDIEVDSVVVPRIGTNSIGNNRREKPVKVEEEKESTTRKVISSISIEV